jgi:hypothetical protein
MSPPEDPGSNPVDSVEAPHAGVPHGSPSVGGVDSSTAVRPFGRIAGAFLAHPVWGGIGGLVGIAALILTLLALLGVFSGSGSKGAKGATVTSAVDEIARRPLWSSPPITYSEANKAAESHEPLPRGQEIEGGAEEPRGYAGEGGALTVPPNAILATQLAKEPEKYVRTGEFEFESGLPVAIVGKVVRVETLTSDFVGSRPAGGSTLRPITQVRLEVVEGNNATYAEFPEIDVSRGSVVIAVGRVAAIGSIEHNTAKAVYLLAGRAEELNASVDSKVLSQLYEDASRGKTEEQAEHEKQEKEDEQIARKVGPGKGGGISLLP